MKRHYEQLINQHLSDYSQMVFIMGPRQVGKTTLSQSIKNQPHSHYINWDDIEDRNLILSGSTAIANKLQFDHLKVEKPLIIFDEIHKYSQWKQFIKGFYDHYQQQCHIIVTGSSRLDVYRKSGDSLMGRYFFYRLHPISVNELLNRKPNQIKPDSDILPPIAPNSSDFDNLLKWGGFPEPFLKKNQQFYNRWSRLRQQQLFKEDIRELTKVQELDQLELLAVLLKNQSGQLTSYTNLAKKVRVSVDTIRRWITILESVYYCFSIRPWTKNITRSLLKEPKYYLWDWSQIDDDGARHENFIASHLLKAVHYWTDSGLGDYGLYFLRDKEKREVDFLVTKNQKPWFMVEVKSSIKEKLSPNLKVFKTQLNVDYCFQVAIDGDYINQDIFDIEDSMKENPLVVPAKTFLAQLV